MSDPKAEAIAYLEEKKVLPLFELLGAKIAVMKPDDPNAFFVEELKRIQALKAKGQPVVLFSENDVDTMFSIFDITGRGTVTRDQLKKALHAVGAEKAADNLPMTNAIDKPTFVRVITMAVASQTL